VLFHTTVRVVRCIAFWNRNYHPHYCKFTVECVSERIVKKSTLDENYDKNLVAQHFCVAFYIADVARRRPRWLRRGSNFTVLLNIRSMRDWQQLVTGHHTCWLQLIINSVILPPVLIVRRFTGIRPRPISGGQHTWQLTGAIFVNDIRHWRRWKAAFSNGWFLSHYRLQQLGRSSELPWNK